jgi:hypothetical protein
MFLAEDFNSVIYVTLPENQRRIEIEWGRALLICADDVYVLGENTLP